MTISIFEAEETDDKFELFYNNVTESAKSIGVGDPILSRQKICQFETHSNLLSQYMALYYEALKSIISSVKNRFNQQGYETVMNLQNLLLKCAMEQDYLEEFEKVTDFYNSDLDKNMLQAHLLKFKLQFKQENVY